MSLRKCITLLQISAWALFIVLVIGILCDFHIDFELGEVNAYHNRKAIPRLKQLVMDMRPILNDLSRQNFFRYFRVDISRECPFQISDALCTARTNCQLTCDCPLDKLPQTWIREDHKQKENQAFSPIKFYDIMKPHLNGNDPWSFDYLNDSTIYVDLQTDKEQYTGYQGQNIWRIIYEENCFNLSKTCNDDNFLFNVISGMHASVSSHLSEYFVEYTDSGQRVRPNADLYYTKVGAHPERLKNLAFALETLIRAFVRYIDIIEKFPIDTGVFAEDIKTKQLLQRLSDITRNIKDEAFSQDLIFGQPTSQADQKATYLQYFRNITQIMDCVDCVKCKVYGKMQVLGVGVAMRIMLKESAVSLTRNELVAFINTLNKWSESIEIIDRMKRRLWVKKLKYASAVALLFGVGYLLARAACWMIVGRRRRDRPHDKNKLKVD